MAMAFTDLFEPTTFPEKITRKKCIEKVGVHFGTPTFFLLGRKGFSSIAMHSTQEVIHTEIGHQHGREGQQHVEVEELGATETT